MTCTLEELRQQHIDDLRRMDALKARIRELEAEMAKRDEDAESWRETVRALNEAARDVSVSGGSHVLEVEATDPLERELDKNMAAWRRCLAVPPVPPADPLAPRTYGVHREELAQCFHDSRGSVIRDLARHVRDFYAWAHEAVERLDGYSAMCAEQEARADAERAAHEQTLATLRRVETQRNELGDALTAERKAHEQTRRWYADELDDACTKAQRVYDANEQLRRAVEHHKLAFQCEAERCDDEQRAHEQTRADLQRLRDGVRSVVDASGVNAWRSRLRALLGGGHE